MRLAYTLLRVALFALFIAVAGRPITGCTKGPGPNRTDSTDTIPVRKAYDSSKFLVHFALNIYKSSSVFQDTFYDHATMVIYVVNGVVRFDSIMNYPPDVNPTSGTDGFYTAKWIPDNIGLINATGGTGFVEPGDTTVVVILNSTGTVIPTWQISTSSTSSNAGGTSSPGWPPGFTFNLCQPGIQYPFQLVQPGSNYFVTMLKDY